MYTIISDFIGYTGEYADADKYILIATIVITTLVLYVFLKTLHDILD